MKLRDYEIIDLVDPVYEYNDDVLKSIPRESLEKMRKNLELLKRNIKRYRQTLEGLKQR